MYYLADSASLLYCTKRWTRDPTHEQFQVESLPPEMESQEERFRHCHVSSQSNLNIQKFKDTEIISQCLYFRDYRRPVCE